MRSTKGKTLFKSSLYKNFHQIPESVKAPLPDPDQQLKYDDEIDARTNNLVDLFIVFKNQKGKTKATIKTKL